MPIQFQKAVVKAPQWSVHSGRPTRKYSCEMGLLEPVFWRKLAAGETIDVNFAHLVRTAPLASPTYHRFHYDFQAYAVPEKFLAPYFDATKFYNIKIAPEDRQPMAVFPLSTYVQACQLMVSNGYALKGSLFDFLGYPIFDDVFYSIQKLNQGLYDGTKTENQLDFAIAQDSSYNISIDDLSDYTDATALDFGAYIGSLFDENADPSAFWFDYSIMQPLSVVTKALNDHNLDIVELSRRYWLWLFGAALFWSVETNLVEGEYTGKSISALPWLVYHKIIADWYLNSNVIDPDKYWAYIARQFTIDAGDPNLANCIRGRGGVEGTTLQEILSYLPFKRFWQSDYFTGCTPTPQTGDAVKIPTGESATMPALWVAEALQKLAVKTNLAGSRYPDWVHMQRGVYPKDNTLDRAICLNSRNFPINISEVTQTNVGDFDKQLDSPAATQYGQGISYDETRGILHYTADEDTYVMIIASIVPEADYVQGVDAIMRKITPEEFLIPDFEPLGPQPVHKSELQFSLASAWDDDIDKAIFAYQPQRFAEFTYFRSAVNGDFRDSLDFWHDARQLSDGVSYSPAFLQIDYERDNLNRIFAVPEGTDHWYCYLAFDVRISLPMHRYIQIGF